MYTLRAHFDFVVGVWLVPFNAIWLRLPFCARQFGLINRCASLRR
jgi:hypothetical protein